MSSRDDYVTSADLSEMDLDLVHHWLSTDAYWALDRTRDNVERAARHSLNFGAFTADRRQVDDIAIFQLSRTALSVE